MEKWKASLYRAALALQPRPAWLRAGAQLFRAQGNIPARQAEGIRRALQAHCAVGAAVALVVSLTLVVTVVAAKLVGCTLPMLAKKIGFDPAVMASPFITTIVDALALLVYFSFATQILGI